jgi:hypothetical protein
MKNILKPKILFVILLLGITSFFANSYYISENSIASSNEENIDSSLGEFSTNQKKKAHSQAESNRNNAEAPSTEKAFVQEVTIDPETKRPVYKMHLPKGKHLYDEEKMNELASDATVEVLSTEDSE